MAEGLIVVYNHEGCNYLTLSVLRISGLNQLEHIWDIFYSRRTLIYVLCKEDGNLFIPTDIKFPFNPLECQEKDLYFVIHRQKI